MVAEGGCRKMSYIQQDDENGSKANEDAMEVIDRYHLDGVKRKKTEAKAACTRTRRKLMALMDSDLPSRRQIRKALHQIDDRVSQLGSTSGGTIWTNWPKTA